MQEVERRLSSVERTMTKMESVMESNSHSLQKIEETLETLTSIQVQQAKDRAEFNAKVLDCKGGLDRAHKRIDKVEGNQTWAVRIILTIVIAAVLASIGLSK